MRRGRQHRSSRGSARAIKLAGFAGLAIAVCGVGYWTWRPKGSNAIPVVTADARPIRVRPVDPGGLNINQVGNLVFSGDSDDTQSSLAAPAESPDAAALHASEKLRAKPQKPGSDRVSGSDG